MIKHKIICTVCSCYCDDIEVEVENNKITKVENACLKGSSFIFRSQESQQRSPCMINRHEANIDKVVDKAAELLSESKNPLIFGLDHLTLEAQTKGIELAQKINGVIDDYSSFSYGTLNEHIIKGSLPTCNFDEVKNADLIVYWGANPQHSHPRHLSEFSYYSNSKYSEISTDRNIEMCVVDVRKTETAIVSSFYVLLSPGGDKPFMETVAKGSEQNIPQKKAQELANFLVNSSFCVLFVGSGLVYSVNNDIASLIDMLNKLDANIKVIPMIDQPNMRGFNQTLYNATGFVNRVSFKKEVSSNDETSFRKQLTDKKTDCILIAGSNPFQNMPASINKYFENIPIITIDPFITETTQHSSVLISPAISGLESGGTVMRMDGSIMHLSSATQTDKINDEQILKMLIDKV